MIKKILPVAIFVLILIFIVLLGLQNILNTKNVQVAGSPTPTLFQGQGGGNTSKTEKVYLPPRTNISTQPLTQEELRNKLPIIAPDFTLDYSPRMEKYILTLKPDETGSVELSQLSYTQWLDQNESYTSLLLPESLVTTQQTVSELHTALDYARKNKLSPEKEYKKNTDTIISIINTLFSPPSSANRPTSLPLPSLSPKLSPTPKLPSKKTPTSTPYALRPTNYKLPSTNYSYYSQCSGPYDELPLPNGCTICEAGCGPTSVAMILSSYIDKSLTPPKTIDLMAKGGVRIGCYGSYISEIYDYLSERGDLKVSDYIIPSEGKLSEKEIAKDLKGYTKAGWTIFVLANFKTDGGGHYFWVTDVNDNGEILAYDPYYGKQQTPPINENRYSPAPYYRYAFAIKKS